MIIDTEQLVTYTEAAGMKGMSKHLLAHHLKHPDAPRPIRIPGSRHVFYDRAAVIAWEPKRDASKGRKQPQW